MLIISDLFHFPRPSISIEPYTFGPYVATAHYFTPCGRRNRTHFIWERTWVGFLDPIPAGVEEHIPSLWGRGRSCDHGGVTTFEAECDAAEARPGGHAR